MRQLFFFFITLIVFPAAALAQETSRHALRSDVVYLKDHLLMQSDSNFNVVDLDVEWPEAIDRTDAKVLRHTLASWALRADTADLFAARRHFLSLFGTPVTAQLPFIPDDHRFCYVTVNATMVSYQPGQWVAYLVQYTAEPQKRSDVKAEQWARSVVYDVTRGEVLTVDDMIRQGAIEGMRADDGFVERLFSPLSDDDIDQLQQTSIYGLWPDGDQMAFYVTHRTTTRLVSYSVALPYQEVRHLLTKRARALVEKKVSATQPVVVTLPQTWKGDTIYNKVDVAPQFVGGQEALQAYIVRAGLPRSGGASGKVEVAFVVDPEGAVQDVHVTGILTPETSRHAAMLVRNMPRFTPGMLKGKPVPVRLFLPISYQ